MNFTLNFTLNFTFQAMPFSDKMSFSERFQNLLINIYDLYVRNYIYLPAEEEIARKNFGHLGPLPPLKDLVHNISIVLINTHRAFFPPRPMMPSKQKIFFNFFQKNYKLIQKKIQNNSNILLIRCNTDWRSSSPTTKGSAE